MSWNSVTEQQMSVARMVVTWIRTAREAGYGGEDWLPSDADVHKSALFERLRSGKEPLPEPPPVALSCPWYAVVEDPSPHNVFDVTRGDGHFLQSDEFLVFQSIFRLVEEIDANHFIVRDGRRDTSYRFHLWFDPTWQHPNQRQTPARAGTRVGMWFLRNVEFEPEKSLAGAPA